MDKKSIHIFSLRSRIFNERMVIQRYLLWISLVLIHIFAKKLIKIILFLRPLNFKGDEGTFRGTFNELIQRIYYKSNISFETLLKPSRKRNGNEVIIERITGFSSEILEYFESLGQVEIRFGKQINSEIKLTPFKIIS